MILIAILLPGISFLLRGKILKGIICIILHATIIGWIPASIWAVMDLMDSRSQERNDKLIRAMRER